MADAHDSKSCTARCGGSSPLSGTIRELIGFLEAKMRDARSASQGFPPIFPNEFGASPSATRTIFSPRSRCEPKISLALTFFAKRSESEAGTIKVYVPKGTDMRYKTLAWIQVALQDFIPEIESTILRWSRLKTAERPPVNI